jgi:hypothetical protein
MKWDARWKMEDAGLGRTCRFIRSGLKALAKTGWALSIFRDLDGRMYHSLGLGWERPEA